MIAVPAGLSGMKAASEGGFQGYSRVHGLFPYPEATFPFKMHLLEGHAVQWANTYHAGFGLWENRELN